MSMHPISRRQMLCGLLASGAGLALAACGGSAGPAGSTAASPAQKPASGGASAQAAGSWDEILAAAKKEGKVVISGPPDPETRTDRKSTRLNSSHLVISYAVFCLKK